MLARNIPSQVDDRGDFHPRAATHRRFPVDPMPSHRPVMLEETLAGLAVGQMGVSPRIYVDATYGRGGHSGAILRQLRPGDILHALDRDPEACESARQTFGVREDFRIHQRNFAELRAWALSENLFGRVNGLLMDLGMSSPQIDQPRRGFSFSNEGPLDMRMDPGEGESAGDWLARASEGEIADVLWRYGQERNSRRIARRIVGVRAVEPLRTTTQLAKLIAAVPGPRSRDIHPATRSFQAIRMHVNNELTALDQALDSIKDLLAPGGRLVVISFHSLEDRLVKRYIREHSQTIRNGESLTPWLRRIGRVFPTPSETGVNPRSRSAVLRVAERLLT